MLLVGETGCGKTTVCQMLAAISQQSLFTVNCHMHTESSDFLGGLRPVRDHSSVSVLCGDTARFCIYLSSLVWGSVLWEGRIYKVVNLFVLTRIRYFAFHNFYFSD